MAIAGTIEEHILFLLYEKISMFNLVIGELDAILSALGDGVGVEKRLYQIVAESVTDPTMLPKRLDELAHSFTEAAMQAEQQASRISHWLTW